MTIEARVLQDFSAQIGEMAQHHLLSDPSIHENGDWYYKLLTELIQRHPHVLERPSPRYLEIACYQHVIGYRLSQDHGFDSTQFDICDRDLEVGRQSALRMGINGSSDRVVGDFHDLPFADGYFDVAMISASIHHTRKPHVIIDEMMRVLAHGGLFYCQREPCERLFCFYEFNANRAAQYTPFESHLHQRDVMRLISSPFPGARNAELFGRVENDRIPLEMYYETFARHGIVKEEILYHEGLLTQMDKRILEHDWLKEEALASYIAWSMLAELELAEPLMSTQDRLLGYSLPTEEQVWELARKVATALKARPANTKTLAWRKAMAKIFGGTLRFVVERQRDDKSRAAGKFRRDCREIDHVRYDDIVHQKSGLLLWTKLLPEMQTAGEDELRAASFPADDWRYDVGKSDIRQMIATAATPVAHARVPENALFAMRYRVVVDDEVSAAKLRVTYGEREVASELIAQTEDRMLRFAVEPDESAITFTLTDLDGNPISAKSRIRISIFQCIPIATEDAAAPARSAVTHLRDWIAGRH